MEFPISPPAQSPTSANGVRGRTSVVGHYRAISWRQGLVVLILLLLDGLPLGNARASEFDEYAVKAAYLYNFAKYVEWPLGMFTSANAPLLICIAGDNPFGDALTTLSGKMIESHPVEIRGLSVTTDLASCHIVFVSRAEQGRFKTLLAKLARQPILTVSDISDFAQAGGMIGLVEVDQRIHFNINLNATRQARLKLSSQLLKLATIVE